MTESNVVMINDENYVFDELTDNAKMAYQQLLSLRNQLADLQMRSDQILAAKSVFEQMLERELTDSPAEAELAEVAEG